MMDTQLHSLILAAQCGDLEAFGTIVKRFQGMAYATAYTMLDDAGLAEDVAQEAFIEAYQNLPELRETVEAQGESGLSEEERQAFRRGQRVEQFLTQPFVVAEPYTDIPGEYVTLDDTIRSFEALLSGQYDDVPEKTLWMKGRLN